MERRLTQDTEYRPHYSYAFPNLDRAERPKKRSNWTQSAIKLKPPDDFVLFRNPELVIDFFKQVERTHANGHDVYFNLLDVTDLTSDTVLLMVSRTNDERFNHRRNVGGAKPNNQKARNVFEESGVFGDKVFDLANIRDTHGSIDRYNAYQVSPQTAAKFVTKAANFFSSRERSAASYDTLIELMQNTNMHAGGNTDSKELWWSSVYCMPDKALFNFLDNGLGICETARKRIGQRILSALGFENNLELLRDIFDDKVMSRTGKYYHGRGLPLIRNRSDRGLIQNAIVITNNVIANISTGEYRLMTTEFQGTFFHWEASFPGRAIIPYIERAESEGVRSDL